MKVSSNTEACVAVGGCSLAVDLLTTAHEASERTAIPLQSNLIAASAFIEPQKEWHYIGKDGVQVGPLEKDALRRALWKKEIDNNCKCWAAGMTDWKRMRDVRELRWALSKGLAVLTPVQVCAIILTEEWVFPSQTLFSDSYCWCKVPEQELAFEIDSLQSDDIVLEKVFLKIVPLLLLALSGWRNSALNLAQDGFCSL